MESPFRFVAAASHSRRETHSAGSGAPQRASARLITMRWISEVPSKIV
jgi:hypothetical protein